MNAKKIIKIEQERLSVKKSRLENCNSILANEVNKQNELEGWDWIKQADEILIWKQEILDIENEILKSQKVIELLKEKEVK